MHQPDTLNLGILAHVDAGKTSLTERCLFQAGLLDALGSVDAGTTQTDSMPLERRRGITIRTNVASFCVDDVQINLIDTPGHPDFIAEVDRALTVLDGAVLLISAVEGVQAQTVILWRALRRFRIPTLVFVNKLDREGADLTRVVGEVRARLDPRALILSRATDTGSASVAVRARHLDRADGLEQLAELDNSALRAWAEERTLSPEQIERTVRRMIGRGQVAAVLAGSALTGAGVAELARAMTRYLPHPQLDPDAKPAGVVFKIDHDERGKHVYVRMRAGEVTVRDRLSLAGREPERVTGMRICRPGGLSSVPCARAGHIAVLDGLRGARIGDRFGAFHPDDDVSVRPPLAEAVVEPRRPEQRGTLFAALTELADADPLIALRSDDTDRDIRVSLHGEVQKEVLSAVLAEDYGVPVEFRETTVVCIERVVGIGASVDRIKEGDNPYLATIGLRIEPAPIGSGIRFALEVERGAMPPAFFAATEEGAHTALGQGLSGWAVEDCLVTMTDADYLARQSHAHQKFNKAFSSVAADYRQLAPVVLMTALRQAGTQVCEPMHAFDLDVPSPSAGAVTSVLGRVGANVVDFTVEAGYTRLAGIVPAARIRDITTRLARLTNGEGAFTSEFDHHRPLQDAPPVKPRRGADPGDRETWFRAHPR